MLLFIAYLVITWSRLWINLCLDKIFEFLIEPNLAEPSLLLSSGTCMIHWCYNKKKRIHTSKWKQPSNDFITGCCSFNLTQDYFYPVKEAKLKAVRKVRNKDLVLSVWVTIFLLGMALLGQFHHIEIKAAFTLKTTWMVLGLLLDLLPILRDSRERQTKPDSPNSVGGASQPPWST